MAYDAARLMAARLYIMLAVAVSSAGGAGWLAWTVTDSRWDAKYSQLQRDHAQSSQAAADALRDYEDAEAARLREADRAATLERRLVDAERTVIIEEVIEYVSSPADRCIIDRDWVRLHDRAARLSAAPDTTAPGGLADAAARPAADVIRTVVSNYQQCAQWAVQLRGLQGYVHGLTEAQ